MAGPQGGRTVSLALHPPGDWVSDEIRRTGTWFESDILLYVAPLAQRGVIVDAGAHIGNHAVYWARHTEAKVHAFEPWPDNFALLKENAADYPQITVHNVALSDRERELFMTADPNLGHVRVAAAGRERIRALPLDAFGLREVALLKIDVEGHEPQVLAGARETIAGSLPLILIEDWTGTYDRLLPGYELIRSWARAHQTYLYGSAAR